MTNGQEETMTSVYNRILGLLAILLVIPACMKLEQEPLADQDIIGFNVVEQSLKTKAAFNTESTFYSSAYKLGAGRNWQADYASSTSFFSEQEVKYKTNHWTTDTEYYWPADGSTLTFFSYSLSGMSVTPGVNIDRSGVSISNYNVSTNPNGEILVADIAMDKTKNESYAGFTGVPTHFRHKLSRVKFEFAKSELADPDATVTLKSVSLLDYYNQGDYSAGGYTGDKWTTENLVNQSEVWSGNEVLLDATLKQFGSTLTMIPQSVNKVSDAQHAGIVVQYSISTGGSTENKSVTCYFDDHFKSGIWEMGKIYTYKIHIGVGLYPILFDGSVGDWSSSDGGNVEIGG